MYVSIISHAVKACLDALSGHTAQGHHWLVAGDHSASPDQPVHAYTTVWRLPSVTSDGGCVDEYILSGPITCNALFT